MSRIAPPAEKVLAISSVYAALWEELHLGEGAADSPVIIAALIDAATRVAMATDTRDMGILGQAPQLQGRAEPEQPEDEERLCQRLKPAGMQCQWLEGHYGGCVSR